MTGSAGSDHATARSGPLRATTVVTERLALEPLRVGHAAELVGVLADPALYAFTGDEPPTTAELERRHAAQAVGHSPDGSADWLNWIVREARGSRPAVGYVQATVTDGTAELAWVIGTPHHGRGFAREAATALAGWLRERGVGTLVAHVHPDHLASTAVARAIGLRATGVLVEGEVQWRNPAVERAVTLRSGRPSDLDRLLPFWAVAAEDSHRPADSVAAVERLFERDRQALSVATIGEVVVGTLIAGFDGWRCHLYRLAVHPSWRRRGIARLLVTAAEQRFAAFGATRADAMVLDDNPDAHGLWAGLGYARQPEWSRWVKAL